MTTQHTNRRLGLIVLSLFVLVLCSTADAEEVISRAITVRRVESHPPVEALSRAFTVRRREPFVATEAVSRSFTVRRVVPIVVTESISRAFTTSRHCAGDFNRDEFVNSADFFEFLVVFFENVAAADFNHDGFVNSQDFFDFLAAFFTPCS